MINDVYFFKKVQDICQDKRIFVIPKPLDQKCYAAGFFSLIVLLERVRCVVIT